MRKLGRKGSGIQAQGQWIPGTKSQFYQLIITLGKWINFLSLSFLLSNFSCSGILSYTKNQTWNWTLLTSSPDRLPPWFFMLITYSTSKRQQPGRKNYHRQKSKDWVEKRGIRKNQEGGGQRKHLQEKRWLHKAFLKLSGWEAFKK